MSVSVKLHPRALFTEIGFCHRWDSSLSPSREGLPNVGVRVAFDNEDPRADLSGPHGTVSAKIPALNLPDNEMIAVAALMQYVHECGEHVQVEGIQLNHHEPHGIHTATRLLKHVVTWLEALHDYDRSVMP